MEGGRALVDWGGLGRSMMLEGSERAAIFNGCSCDAKTIWHFSPLAVSRRDGFIYQDNDKAGSTSLRTLLKPLFVTLPDAVPPQPHSDRKERGCQSGRPT